MKDILSAQFVWLDEGIDFVQSVGDAGFRDIMDLQFVWMAEGITFTPAPSVPSITPAIATNPGLRTATLTGVGL